MSCVMWKDATWGIYRFYSQPRAHWVLPLCTYQICLKYSDTWTPCHILCGSVVLMLSDGWSGYYCQELSERQESNSGWVEFEFNGPVDTIEVLSSRSVYQTTILSLCAYTFTSNRQLLYMNLQKGGERQMISWSISASYLAPLSLSLSLGRGSTWRKYCWQGRSMSTQINKTQYHTCPTYWRIPNSCWYVYKLLDNLQTMQTLIRRRVLWRLIWVYIVWSSLCRPNQRPRSTLFAQAYLTQARIELTIIC